jgi:hypothetical protein
MAYFQLSGVATLGNKFWTCQRPKKLECIFPNKLLIQPLALLALVFYYNGPDKNQAAIAPYVLSSSSNSNFEINRYRTAIRVQGPAS